MTDRRPGATGVTGVTGEGVNWSAFLVVLGLRLVYGRSLPASDLSSLILATPTTLVRLR